MDTRLRRADFLSRLYEYCEGQIELRALPSKHQKFCQLDDLNTVGDFCRKHSGENVYFAVATRNGGGTKEHIQHIPAVWCDIDFKDTPRDQANKKLADFPLRPTFCVESGNGYHVYWMLKEVYGKENIETIEALLRQIAASLHGDPAATDASRILRVPDTKNHKYTPPRPVKCVMSRDARYDISDFEFLPSADANVPIKGTSIKCKVPYRAVTQNVTRDGQKSRNKRNIEFVEGHRDESLFHLAHYLVKGGMPRDEVVTYLNFVGKHCDPPFPDKEIEAKVKSALKRTERGKIALTSEIRKWISVTSGWFSVTSAYQSVTNVTARDRTKVRVILNRLVKEGELERHDSQDGIFRRVEAEARKIDFMNAATDPLSIRWPFGIQNLVEIMPKNVIVVAGEIEAGKTAFLLNLARLNMQEFDTWYFSSEMGDKELKKRLSRFDDLALSDWTAEFMDLEKEPYTLVKPDALNIFDYLELHDDFFKIGGSLKKIYNRLNDGIAIVGLQKPKGRDEGLGGQRSMEVARLYLSMSNEYPSGRLKIVKGKNWATDRNPNGLSIAYNIVRGCQLIQQGNWTRTD